MKGRALQAGSGVHQPPAIGRTELGHSESIERPEVVTPRGFLYLTGLSVSTCGAAIAVAEDGESPSRRFMLQVRMPLIKETVGIFARGPGSGCSVARCVALR